MVRPPTHSAPSPTPGTPARIGGLSFMVLAGTEAPFGNALPMSSNIKISCFGVSSLKTLLLGAALACATLAGAQAQVIYRGVAAPAYGYAGPAIRGDYVGAPLTRFPRPDQIVPSAWGYGTYGVPTVSGLPPAPVGTPTVYVIDAPATRPRTAERSRILARHGKPLASRMPEVSPYAAAGAARVVTVRVPPRQAALP